MNFLRKLYSFEDNLDFRKGWKVAFAFSAVVLALGIGFMATRGLVLGIDFRGGTAWQFPANHTSTNDVRDALKGAGEGDAQIQSLGTDKGEFIRVEVGLKADKTEVADALAKSTKQSVDVINENRSDVGPSWGKDVSRKALQALIIFFIAIAAYISWQLEWRMAVGALAAVIHDLVISVGVYAIFQFEITPGTVVAFLTVLGYSLYDTVVVYDKVKDNQSKVTLNGTMTYTDMMNLSLNQTVMRSISTTLSGLLPVASILVVGAMIMGAVTLEEFGLALLVGLFVGAYSSVFIATPIVAWLKEREPRNRQIRDRLAGSTGPLLDAPVGAGAGAASGTAEEGSEVVASPKARAAASGSTLYSANHPPRPRKKGKKR